LSSRSINIFMCTLPPTSSPICYTSIWCGALWAKGH
jgi:hypothetical protein